MDHPVDKPAAKPAEKPVTQLSAKPADKPAEKSIDHAAACPHIVKPSRVREGRPFPLGATWGGTEYAWTSPTIERYGATP